MTNLYSSPVVNQVQSRILYRWLLALLLISLLIRWFFVAYGLYIGGTSLFTSNDTPSYIFSAHALVETGAFSVSPTDLRPQSVRTPGYPLFLAFIFRLFGENLALVLAIQAIFSVATIGLVYLFGSRLWNDRIGLLAAFLLAIDINSIGFSLQVLTESMFTFFLVLFMFLFVLLFYQDDIRYNHTLAFLSGFVLAISAHFRPISYYLMFPVLLFLFVGGILRKWDKKRLIQAILLFSFPLLILLGGWQVRNVFWTGSSQFSSIESINIVNYRAAMIVVENKGVSRDTAIELIHDEYNLDSAPGWNEKWRAAGIDIIRKNPKIFVKQYIQGLLSIFAGPGLEIVASLSGLTVDKNGPLGDLRRISAAEYLQKWLLGQPVYFLLFIFSFLYMVGIYISSVLAIGKIFTKKITLPIVFLMVVFFYLSFISAGPEAYYRFRVPLAPIMVLFSAFVINAWATNSAFLQKSFLVSFISRNSYSKDGNHHGS